MKKLALLGVTALLATPTAFAGMSMPAGQATVFVTSAAADIDTVGKIDGTGFGIRGWATVAEPFFLTGEYSKVTLEDDSGGEADLDELRLGGGLAGEIQQGFMWLARAEYVDFGGDFDQSGFGIHGGLMFNVDAFSLMGSVGYLNTSGTGAPLVPFDVDGDGMEYNVGASFAFTKELSAVLDYRLYQNTIENSTGSADIDYTDLRLGLTYSFF